MVRISAACPLIRPRAMLRAASGWRQTMPPAQASAIPLHTSCDHWAPGLQLRPVPRAAQARCMTSGWCRVAADRAVQPEASPRSLGTRAATAPCPPSNPLAVHGHPGCNCALSPDRAHERWRERERATNRNQVRSLRKRDQQPWREHREMVGMRRVGQTRRAQKARTDAGADARWTSSGGTFDMVESNRR